MDNPQDLFDPPLALGAWDALHAQAVPDVLRHGHMREERVVLEDGVDVALVGRPVRDVVAAELDSPLVQALEAGDEPQRRRLAGSGRAEQRKELAGRDLEIDPVDRHDVAVRLANPVKPDIDLRRRHAMCADSDSASAGVAKRFLQQVESALEQRVVDREGHEDANDVSVDTAREQDEAAVMCR